MTRSVSKLLLIPAGLVLGLLLTEGLLRIAGFEHTAAPAVKDPMKLFLQEPAFVADRDLFWVKEGYGELLRRARRQGPALALLGDSCTEDNSYVEPLARLASARLPGRQLSYINLGVGAWSSHQGLGQLRRDVAPLGVKVATLFFGWNDHWINNQVSDREAAEMMRGPVMSIGSLKLVQLARKAWTGAVGRGRGTDRATLRVPLPQFRANLAAMIRQAREAGITPMLITAPTANRPGERPLPDLEGAVHLEYVAAVKTVAAREKAALCDLHLKFSALPPEQLKASFTGDGIHFNGQGGSQAAGWLLGCLEKEGLLERVVVRTGNKN